MRPVIQELNAFIVAEPIMALLFGLIAMCFIILILKMMKAFLPPSFYEFKRIGKFVGKVLEAFGGFMMFLVSIPFKIRKSIKKAKYERRLKREAQIEEAARKMVDALPKVKTVIREMDEYTYCYNCDIHYNKKLPECPNCFAQDLAKADVKAIFSILKGVREFRYLSFDREQDLIKFISERMIGDKIDDLGKKD